MDLTKYVEEHPFVFDEVFGRHSTNEEVRVCVCRDCLCAL